MALLRMIRTLSDDSGNLLPCQNENGVLPVSLTNAICEDSSPNSLNENDFRTPPVKKDCKKSEYNIGARRPRANSDHSPLRVKNLMAEQYSCLSDDRSAPHYGGEEVEFPPLLGCSKKTQSLRSCPGVVLLVGPHAEVETAQKEIRSMERNGGLYHLVPQEKDSP